MSFGEIAAAYLFSLAAFLVLDLLWLGLVAKGFYAKHLGTFFAQKVKWPAACLFYLVYIAGLTFFATHPAAGGGSLATAVGRGAAYGLCTYATYDLTNLATLKGWPLPLVVVDMAWGIVLSAAISALGYWAAVLLR